MEHNYFERILLGKSLLNAAGKGNLDEVKKILESDYNDLVNFDDFKNTPLIFACATGGNIELIEYLLEKKADVNIQGVDGNTALHTVIQNRCSCSILNTLLRANPNLELKNIKHQTPLILAVQKESFAIVQDLIAARANLETGDQYLQTPLMHAVMTENNPIVKLLLEAGANPYAKNRYGIDVFALALNETIKLSLEETINVLEQRLKVIHFPHQQIPDCFLDPISHKMLVDPVCLSSGFTCNRTTLKRMIMDSPDTDYVYCPKTFEKISKSEIQSPTNELIKEMAEKFVSSREQLYLAEQNKKEGNATTETNQHRFFTDAGSKKAVNEDMNSRISAKPL